MVEEQPPVRGGRVFLLSKVGPGAPADDYETFVYLSGGKSRCSCPCGRVGRFECSHVTALRELIRAGHIEHPGERPAGR